MKVHLDTTDFVASEAWEARTIDIIDGVSVRLHWTDQPYKWHINDGSEVFVVLSGDVDMHYREAGIEKVQRLNPGHIFVAEDGDAHVAHPVGEARILVIERDGSV